MNNENNPVQVSIYGMEFAVKGGEDQNYTISVAQFVNNKMLELEKTMQSKSTLRVAVLAALNIADELFQSQKNLKKLEEEISVRSQQILNKVTSRLSP